MSKIAVCRCGVDIHLVPLGLTPGLVGWLWADSGGGLRCTDGADHDLFAAAPPPSPVPDPTRLRGPYE